MPTVCGIMLSCGADRLRHVMHHMHVMYIYIYIYREREREMYLM